jgi:hypothetical protein
MLSGATALALRKMEFAVVPKHVIGMDRSHLYETVLLSSRRRGVGRPMPWCASLPNLLAKASPVP